MKVPVQLQDQLVPEFPAAIDNTMRSLFALCPRKFFIEFVLNRALVGHRVDLDPRLHVPQDSLGNLVGAEVALPLITDPFRKTYAGNCTTRTP